MVKFIICQIRNCHKFNFIPLIVSTISNISTFFLILCIFSDISSCEDSSSCDSKHLIPTPVQNKKEVQNENRDNQVTPRVMRGDKTSETVGVQSDQRYSWDMRRARLGHCLPSDTDCNHRDSSHQICSQDQLFSRLFGAREMSANYAANEALITDTASVEADTEDAVEAEFARLAEYEQGRRQSDDSSRGELVCTLRVPEIIPEPRVASDDSGGGGSLLTPDSDRDSGCFSEELGVKGGATDPVSRLNDVDTNLAVNRDVCKLKRGKSVHLNFPRPSYRPAHHYTGGPRPFQRKIWKRRNGWFRVRYPSGLGQEPSVRSQLSETAADPEPSHDTEDLKFLRAREAAKECEARPGWRGGREEKITFEQELSDNDQGLEIFPDTSDTIKANRDRDSPAFQSGDLSASGGRPVSDLQLQLAEMRLEIARMVEEAERLDMTEDSEDSEDDSSWHLDYASPDSESDASEIIGEEFSYSDCTDET